MTNSPAVIDQLRKRAKDAEQPRVMYHISPVENHEAILHEGLRADKSSPHAGADWPAGVYLWETLQHAEWYAENYISGSPEDWRMYAVNTGGLPLERDPYGQFAGNEEAQADSEGAHVSYYDPIEPGRIQPMQFDDETWRWTHEAHTEPEVMRRGCSY